MSKGVLIYALNNEQIDYVKLAVNAAKNVKKHLNVKSTLVTDSADWLYKQYPDWEDYFDFVIKIVHESGIEKWHSSANYPIGSLVYYNGTIWRKVKDGDEIIKVKNKVYIPSFNEKLFERIYKGIDIDKWYPNLPYLKGQHVWHEKILYRCHTDYQEENSFSVNNYDILLENIVDDFNKVEIGQSLLHDRVLWLKTKSLKDLVPIFEETNFDRIYENIKVDKWYPNLYYLKGQHIWHENTIYRCKLGYTEGKDFSKEKYIVLIENVYDYDYTKIVSLKIGDKILYDGMLWLSKISFDTEMEYYFEYESKDLDPVYDGIDIDKWYPNLPYLDGQHVWYNNTLYRCHTSYEEENEFSTSKYDTIVENVKDLSTIEKFNIGDILLHNRTLWMSKVNYDSTLKQQRIREDIWEDTKERFLIHDSSIQYRRYFDGSLSNKRLRFKNNIRIKSFEISPYDETLVIDCDYVINNDVLKYCWQQPHDFLIYKNAMDLSGYRYDPRFNTLSDKSIDFYWATVFYFRKNSNTEIFFNYLSHIQDNWEYYRLIYQIDYSLYRNDYAFSIAIHVMNGYQHGTWAHELPGKLYFTTDRDLLIDYNDKKMKFLIEKEKYKGEYTIMSVNGLNVHVMNKFSLSRELDNIHNIEYS